MTGLSDYACKEKGGDHLEDAVCGYRLRDRSGFCLSSFSSAVPEWHVAKRSLRLRRLRPIGTYRAGRWQIGFREASCERVNPQVARLKERRLGIRKSGFP